MIFVQENDAAANAVHAFRRLPDGTLEPLGVHPTGGRGDGRPHLPSQGSLAVADGQLLVANAGSGDVSVLAVGDGGLALVSRTPTAGGRPVSIAVHAPLVAVLDGGADPGVTVFRLADGALEQVGGRAALGTDADPAQVGFAPDGRALVVTARGTNAIVVVPLDADGAPGTPVEHPSSGRTPYGFDFAGGHLVVTEAFGGMPGAAAASSYELDGTALRPVSASVGDGRSEVCWAVAGADGGTVWVTNFGDGTVSAYAVGADGVLELREAVAATTVAGVKGIRDAARSGDGRFLYALDADERKVFGWRVEAGGRLAPLGAVDGLPETAAGLAAL